MKDARRYIDNIDFRLLKAKNSSPEFGALGWRTRRLDFVEGQYRNWLFLRRLYESKLLVAPADVDDFWHAHILETRAYHRDCGAIFGYYLHHDPYFGFQDPDEFAQLEAAFERTNVLYLQHYGEEILCFGDEEMRLIEPGCPTEREVD